MTVRCPGCGAPVEMLPGPVPSQQRCDFCDAALLHPAVVQQRAAASLAHQARQELLAGLRARRAADLALLSPAPVPGYPGC